MFKKLCSGTGDMCQEPYASNKLYYIASAMHIKLLQLEAKIRNFKLDYRDQRTKKHGNKGIARTREDTYTSR